MSSRWIIPIIGFRESAASRTGLEKVWADMRQYISSDLCVVTPRLWDDDMKAFAAFVLRNSACKPRCLVIAYSWGCGVGFKEFAEEAWRLGIQIDTAVLCDPVYRSRWLPKWIPVNPLSISPVFRPSISIPPSVTRVVWMRQRVDLPAGHDLVAEDSILTRIEPPQWVQVGHTKIDDSAAFQKTVHEEVLRFVSETGDHK